MGKKRFIPEPTKEIEMNKNVLIVGAGLGGLATALRLSKKGFQVEIIEKNAQAGGRLNRIKKDGFTFDTGPSFFSMSYEFDEFAHDCGIELPFEFVELDPLYTVNFGNSPKTYFLYKDIKKLAAQFSDVEPDFEKKMLRYLKKSGKLFDDTVDIVIKNNFDSVLGYLLTLMHVNPVHLPVLARSFWKQVTLNFSSEQARQIISLVAFFLGRTPFDTMAVYTLLSYTEFRHDGYYNVKGGMYNIVEGLLAELKKENVRVSYNTEITDFIEKDGKLESLVDQNGKQWSADIVVINSDAAVFRNSVFRRPNFSDARMKKMNWTMGYLTFYIGIKCKLPHVNHHNYYLGNNYQEYADQVMKNPDTPEQPYYYVNVVSKHNDECAPEGCESLFFVCPVPNLLFKKDWSDRDKIVNSIIADFSKRIGQDIQPEIVSKTIYTPEDWQNQFNLYMGSGLGLSHSMAQIGAFRPKNFDERFKNTFYVGASTVPGAGLPMAIISSKLVVERIKKFSKK
jgi:phytoene desaturase